MTIIPVGNDLAKSDRSPMLPFSGFLVCRI